MGVIRFIGKKKIGWQVNPPAAWENRRIRWSEHSVGWIEDCVSIQGFHRSAGSVEIFVRGGAQRQRGWCLCMWWSKEEGSKRKSKRKQGSWRGVHVSSFLHAGSSRLPGCQAIGWFVVRANSHTSQEPWPRNCESQKKVSKGRPKTLPKSCDVVTGPQPNTISMNFYSCEVLT